MSESPSLPSSRKYAHFGGDGSQTTLVGQSIPPAGSGTPCIRPLGLGARDGAYADYIEGIDMGGKHGGTFDERTKRKNLSKRTISMDIKAKEYGWTAEGDELLIETEATKVDDSHKTAPFGAATGASTENMASLASPSKATNVRAKSQYLIHSARGTPVQSFNLMGQGLTATPSDNAHQFGYGLHAPTEVQTHMDQIRMRMSIQQQPQGLR